MDSKKFCISLFLMLCLTANAWSQIWSPGYVLIGNDVPKKSFSKGEVKSVFKGEWTSWNNGASVVVVLPGSKSPFASEFSKNILGTSVQGMQKFWLSLVFQGRANPPVFVDSPQDALQFVKYNKGAIAVVNLPPVEIPSYLILNVQP
jgi:ABC-type phosphate transport system substrate-binding protein